MTADLIDHGYDIEKEVVVPAPRAEVWRAWTTSEGAAAFFAPAARIVLEPGGPYELYFDPEAPVGSRGSEGMRVLSYLPGEMLSFEWNAPPRFPGLRAGTELTWVVVRLDDAVTSAPVRPAESPITAAGRPGGAPASPATRVRLAHLGWREGGEWPQVRDYFERAWDLVLDRLVRRFESGPIDWDAPDP